MDLMAPLSDDKLSEVVELLKPFKYRDGEHIISQGESGKNFYIVKAGHVKCTRSEVKGGEETEIGDLFPGDYFGEGLFLYRD